MRPEKYPIDRAQGPEKEHSRFGESISAYVCVPNASFLTEKDHAVYELWPNRKVDAVIPLCMNNIQPMLSRADIDVRNFNGRIKALYEDHAAVQGRYDHGKRSLVGENPAEQAAIN